MTTSLIMHGAAGRMGQRILSLAAEDAAGFDIIAGVDRNSGSLRDLGVASDAPLTAEIPGAARRGGHRFQSRQRHPGGD